MPIVIEKCRSARIGSHTAVLKAKLSRCISSVHNVHKHFARHMGTAERTGWLAVDVHTYTFKKTGGCMVD